MTKRKRELEDVEAVFERILAVAANQRSIPDETLSAFLLWMKSKIVSQDQHDVVDKRSRAAEEFTLEEAVHAFGLKYSAGSSLSAQIRQTWQIQDMPGAQNFPMTPCLGKTQALTKFPLPWRL